MYSLQVLGPRSPRSRCGRTIWCLKALGGSFLPLPAPGRPSWASPGCGHIAPFASAVMRLLPVRLRPRLCFMRIQDRSAPAGPQFRQRHLPRPCFQGSSHSQVEGLGQEPFSEETVQPTVLGQDDPNRPGTESLGTVAAAEDCLPFRGMARAGGADEGHGQILRALLCVRDPTGRELRQCGSRGGAGRWRPALGGLHQPGCRPLGCTCFRTFRDQKTTTKQHTLKF